MLPTADAVANLAIAITAAQTAACHACVISQPRTSTRQWRGIMTDTSRNERAIAH
jgi:hypothetical protein